MAQDSRAVHVTEQPSSGGLSIVASVGPGRKPILYTQDPAITDWVEIASTGWKHWRDFLLPFWPSRRYGCGHISVKKFMVRIWGATVSPVTDTFCADCALSEIQKVAIRCCLCGLPILPTDGVALYDRESVVGKDYEFVTIDESAIGCMRWDCCPSGGFCAGYWTSEGFKLDWS